MIKKIQTKFIVIAMLATTFVTCSIFGVITIENYFMIDNQLLSIMNLIIENNGSMPEYKQKSDDQESAFINKETQFTTRYFIIKINSDGEIVETNMDYIAAITPEDVDDILHTVLEKQENEGYYENYKYKIIQDGEYRQIIFLDGSILLNSFYSTTKKSIFIIIGGLLIVFVIISILSKRILSPMIQSMEKQKQFITNAGHELKTPVAVIMADADVMEMESKENKELIKSIKNQAKRLDALIKSLLNLANMEEKNVEINYTKFSITEIINTEINEFKALAKNKIIIYDNSKDVQIKADENSIKQLITILLDNAIKYTPDNGVIEIVTENQGKNTKIQFSNTCENAQSIDTRKIFDRFYRQDKSRNKEKEGYGIGLSMAKSIVEMHKGKITATTDKKEKICFTVILQR